MVCVIGKVRDLRQVESVAVFEKRGGECVDTEKRLRSKSEQVEFLLGQLKSEKLQRAKAEKRGKDAPAEKEFVLVPYQKEKNLAKMLRKVQEREKESWQVCEPKSESEGTSPEPAEQEE